MRHESAVDTWQNKTRLAAEQNPAGVPSGEGRQGVALRALTMSANFELNLSRHLKSGRSVLEGTVAQSGEIGDTSEVMSAMSCSDTADLREDSA